MCQFYLVKRRLRGGEGVKNCRFWDDIVYGRPLTRLGSYVRLETSRNSKRHQSYGFTLVLYMSSSVLLKIRSNFCSLSVIRYIQWNDIWSLNWQTHNHLTCHWKLGLPCNLCQTCMTLHHRLFRSGPHCLLLFALFWFISVWIADSLHWHSCVFKSGYHKYWQDND